MAYTSSFLANRRKAWKNSLGQWQVYENGAWKDAVVNDMTISGTDITVLLYSQNAGSSGTITQVRVFDTLGSVAATWSTSISRASTQNVLLKLVLPIKEV